MTKKLNIAIVSPLEERVPPAKYAGTERVVYNLCEGLTKRGHHVTLLASGQSKISGKVIPITKRPIRTDSVGQDEKKREASKLYGIAKVLKILQKEKFDIVHNHIGWRLLIFSDLVKTPMVTTLHGPMNLEYQNYVYNIFARSSYISISNDQRAPNKKINYVSTVYNGINLDKFTFNNTPKKYLAFLGRMSPEKGPKQAILVAKKAGIPLIMAAKIDLVDREYFKKEIEPFIDGKFIRYIGEIGDREKDELLKNAIALLALIQWREPFGLFVIEAMACGTPVIASPLGALPELIVKNVTGYFVKNTDEAVKKIKVVSHLSRIRCREHVEKNFSLEKMVEGYEKAYFKILKK